MSILSLNARKYGPKRLRIRKLFTEYQEKHKSLILLLLFLKKVKIFKTVIGTKLRSRVTKI